MLALLFLPTGPWHTTYWSAAADANVWAGVPESELLHTRSWFGAEDHVVRHGRLFLRVLSTNPGLVLITWVDPARWDTDGIARYRAAHPELEELWPDPSLADGGVRWLRR